MRSLRLTGPGRRLFLAGPATDGLGLLAGSAPRRLGVLPGATAHRLGLLPGPGRRPRGTPARAVPVRAGPVRFGARRPLGGRLSGTARFRPGRRFPVAARNVLRTGRRFGDRGPVGTRVRAEATPHPLVPRGVRRAVPVEPARRALLAGGAQRPLRVGAVRGAALARPTGGAVLAELPRCAVRAGGDRIGVPVVAEGAVRAQRAVDAGEPVANGRAVAGRRAVAGGGRGINRAFGGRAFGGRREVARVGGRRLRCVVVAPAARRAGGRRGLVGGDTVGRRRVEAGRHLEAAGGGAHRRDLDGGGRRRRQPRLRPAVLAAGRRVLGGAPGRTGLGVGEPVLRPGRLLGRRRWALRGHHQPVVARVAALVAGDAGRGAHRDLAVDRRVVGGVVDAVGVVAVDPGRRLGRGRAGQRWRQVAVPRGRGGPTGGRLGRTPWRGRLAGAGDLPAPGPTGRRGRPPAAGTGQVVLRTRAVAVLPRVGGTGLPCFTHRALLGRPR